MPVFLLVEPTYIKSASLYEVMFYTVLYIAYSLLDFTFSVNMPVMFSVELPNHFGRKVESTLLV